MSDLFFILDFAIWNAIQKRFEQPGYQISDAIKYFLIKVANNEDFSKQHKLVTEFYQTDFEP